MIVQIMLIIGAISAIFVGLVLLVSAIGILLTPPAQPLPVPVEDHQDHLPR